MFAVEYPLVAFEVPGRASPSSAFFVILNGSSPSLGNARACACDTSLRRVWCLRVCWECDHAKLNPRRPLVFVQAAPLPPEFSIDTSLGN